jgi:hypothetical protein
MAAVPAHANALAWFPLSDASTDCVYDADHFVAGHARILDSRPLTFFDERVAVADAAGLNFDSYLAWTGLWNFTFNQFERPA